MERQANHWSWDQLESDQPLEGITRWRVLGEKVMLSRVALAQGTVVASHSHDNEQMACVVEGAVRFGLGDPESDGHHELVVRAGEVLHLPSGIPHAATALEDSVVLDVFAPPSETTGIDEQG